MFPLNLPNALTLVRMDPLADKRRKLEESSPRPEAPG
jgi:hypothetical protein